MGKILSNIQKFQYSIQSAEKLSIDKAKFDKFLDKSKNNQEIKFNSGIIVKNLSYSYKKNFKDEKNLVLKDISLDIRPSSKIGIVGTSGSGKSTLVDLLMGMITPQKGEILIDGTNLNLIKKNWYKIIGCVPQDVFILDQSLKRNIAFGLPENEINLSKS